MHIDSWPFGHLKPSAYGLIVVDFPTEFRMFTEAGQGKSASQHYSVESIDDCISQFPIHRLADPNGCLVVMWTTGALLASGDARKLMQGVGFKPSSVGTWLKVTANALPAFGTGYILRDAAEFFMTGTRGRMPKGFKRTERNAILGPLREHSRKPDEMYEMLERLLPDARKCNVFGRQSRPGWDVWGDQADKFDSSLSVGAMS